MTTDLKIYTAAEVASVGFSKEQIEQAVAKVTQIAYKAARYGESSITHGGNPHLLYQIAHRLRELGYSTKIIKKSISGVCIAIRWDIDQTPQQEKE